MKGNETFERNNPASVFVYYICVVAPVMFHHESRYNNAVSCRLGVFIIYRPGADRRSLSYIHAYTFRHHDSGGPNFYHNGETVLFVMNDNPITLEATIYGTVSAAAVISVLYRSRSFTLYDKRQAALSFQHSIVKSGSYLNNGASLCPLIRPPRTPCSRRTASGRTLQGKKYD